MKETVQVKNCGEIWSNDEEKSNRFNRIHAWGIQKKMTMTVAAEGKKTTRERWRSAKISKAVMNNRKCVQRDGKKVMRREHKKNKKKKREHVRWILQIVGTSLACDVMMVMAWRCQLSTQAHMKQVKDDENAHAHHPQWENCIVRARARAHTLNTICVNRFIRCKKIHMHTATECNSSSRKSQETEHANREKRSLKKELKLLAMIKPTHRMFTITCALRRENTFIQFVVLIRQHSHVAFCCAAADAICTILQLFSQQQFYSLQWFVCNLSPWWVSAKEKKNTLEPNAFCTLRTCSEQTRRRKKNAGDNRKRSNND